MKISKNSSVKHYQENKEIKTTKRSSQRISTSFLKKKKKKSDNMVVNDTKI